MADSLIILFDISGSMGGSFENDKNYINGSEVVNEFSKIIAAKNKLIEILEDERTKEIHFNIITIIPFHSFVEEPFTGHLMNDFEKIKSFILSLKPKGNTLLAEALKIAIKIGKTFVESDFVNYYIITDGQSHTKEEDLKLLKEFPTRQRINGICIDPTDEGYHHLKKLCNYGFCHKVTSKGEFEDKLTESHKDSLNRKALFMSIKENTNSQFKLLAKKSNDIKIFNPLKDTIIEAMNDAFKKVSGMINNSNYSINEINKHISSYNDKIKNTINLIEDLDNIEKEYKKMKLLIYYPKKMSKRYSSKFLITIFPFDKLNELISNIKKELKKHYDKYNQDIHDINVIPNQNIKIKLNSTDITFSESIKKNILDNINKIYFFAKPKDNCSPGKHQILISISNENDYEIFSYSFEIKVVDFLFDHISRPFVSNLSSVILGIGSFITYILTLFGQLDQTFGLTSGTIAGVLAIFIKLNILRIYNLLTNKKQIN